MRELLKCLYAPHRVGSAGTAVKTSQLITRHLQNV